MIGLRNRFYESSSLPRRSCVCPFITSPPLARSRPHCSASTVSCYLLLTLTNVLCAEKQPLKRSAAHIHRASLNFLKPTLASCFIRFVFGTCKASPQSLNGSRRSLAGASAVQTVCTHRRQRRRNFHPGCPPGQCRYHGQVETGPPRAAPAQDAASGMAFHVYNIRIKSER